MPCHGHEDTGLIPLNRYNVETAGFRTAVEQVIKVEIRVGEVLFVERLKPGLFVPV